MTTPTLTEFLTARFDEDEAVAKRATDGGFGWRLADLAGGNEVWADRDAGGWDAFMIATTATRLNRNPGAKGFDDANHIARHDPARVLAEVEAKRRIVAFAKHLPSVYARCVLEPMALPYADHPDYDEAWRP